jgi:hypothetical protein
MTFNEIVSGKGKFQDLNGYAYKELAPHILCKDETKLSVQASHTHYCTPRTNDGPYTTVEVGYPTATPPETWAEYADGDYPSDVYGYVPVEMVKEFIDQHGGEA